MINRNLEKVIGDEKYLWFDNCGKKSSVHRVLFLIKYQEKKNKKLKRMGEKKGKENGRKTKVVSSVLKTSTLNSKSIICHLEAISYNKTFSS